MMLSQGNALKIMIFRILGLGVDAIELYSEMLDRSRKDIVEKVRTYAKENNQFIPIIYNISYFRIYISQINISDDQEVKINQNQFLYITNNNINIDNLSKQIKSTILPETIDSKDGSILDGKMQKNLERKNSINVQSTSIIVTEPILNFKNFDKSDILHINYGEVSLKVEEVSEEYIKCISLNSGNIQKFNSVSVEAKEHFTNDLIYNDVGKLNREIESAVKLKVEFLVISIKEQPQVEIQY